MYLYVLHKRIKERKERETSCQKYHLADRKLMIERPNSHSSRFYFFNKLLNIIIKVLANTFQLQLVYDTFTGL